MKNKNINSNTSLDPLELKELCFDQLEEYLYGDLEFMEDDKIEEVLKSMHYSIEFTEDIITKNINQIILSIISLEISTDIKDFEDVMKMIKSMIILNQYSSMITNNIVEKVYKETIEKYCLKLDLYKETLPNFDSKLITSLFLNKYDPDSQFGYNHIMDISYHFDMIKKNINKEDTEEFINSFSILYKIKNYFCYWR